MMSLAAGQFAPKLAMSDGSIPPDNPELKAAFKVAIPIWPKLTVLAASSACPTADI